MFSILLTLVLFVGASPEPCEKFDGAEYDKCVDNLMSDDNVVVKEVDVKNSGESKCSSAPNATAMKKCIADAKLQATRNAKERQQREETNKAAGTHVPDHGDDKCLPDTIVNNCEKAHKTAQSLMSMIGEGDKDDRADAKKANKACIAACTLVTPSVGILIEGCSNKAEKRRDVRAKISDKHKTCLVAGGGTGRTNNAEAFDGEETTNADSGLPAGSATDQNNYIVKETEDGQQAVCENGTLIGGVRMCRTLGYNPSTCHSMMDGVGKDTCLRNSGSREYYEDFYGRSYTNYNDAFVGSSTPIMGWGTEVDTAAGGTSAGGSTTRGTTSAGGSTVAGGSVSGRSSGGSSSGGQATRASSDADGGSGSGSNSGGQQTQAQQQKPSTQQQQQASTTGGAATTGATSSGSGYSNPFANSSLNLNSGSSNSGSAGSNNPQYQAISKSNDFNAPGEGVSGLSDDSGGGSSSGGSFNYGGSRSASVKGSEGTNREAAFIGSSDRTVAALDNKDRGSVSRVSGDKEQLGTANFQSGLHKAPEPRILSARDRAALADKINKLKKRRRITNSCKTGNMQCIADILGQSNSKKSERDLASTTKLPNGVWKGYTDILTHMKKVHDNMPMNYEGDIGND